MKKSNAGRITRPDQAWAAAHREKATREGKGTALTVVPQAAPQVEVIPATQSLNVPLKFVYAALMTCGKDDIRHNLNGIYVHAAPTGEVRIVGTDGHRMVVSRFQLPRDEVLPSWAADGFIIPREDLAQAMPILSKHVGPHNEPSLIIDHKPGDQFITVRSILDFASFKVRPVAGKFPEYAKVLESAGASLVRGEGDAMTTTAINAAYLKGAAEIAGRLNAKAIHSFLGDGQAAAVFTFEGAPDTLLIVMPMRAGEAVSDGVVKLLGAGGVSGSIGALKAHVTRTVKLLESVKDPKEREQLEQRKVGFENRIAHIVKVINTGPKQLAAA